MHAMNSPVRHRIWVLIVASLMLCASPGWGAPQPGLEDTLFGTNGKAATTDPTDATKATGRECPMAKSGDIETDYSLAVDLFGQIAVGSTDAFYGLFTGTLSAYVDGSAHRSIYGCTGVPSNSAPLASKAPATATNDIYAAGSIDGDAAIVVYQTGSNTFTGIPIHLSSSGSDRLLGIAHLSGSTFAVAGEINSAAEALIVDLSGVTPQVTPGFYIDAGSPDNVFFDLALNHAGTTGYAVGRTGASLLVCKIDYPGGKPNSDFGCKSYSINDGAEGHQVVILNNGDIAIVGTFYTSAVPRMFIAVLNGMTGAPDTAFDTDGLWVEGITNSTQSEGWGLVAMDFGFAAVGWADISGNRELIMPVFDGLQPDTRYPNSGIVHEAIGTGGHAISVARVTPAVAAPLSPAVASQDFDFAVAGDENDGADMFVIQYQGVQPDSLFGNGFE